MVEKSVRAEALKCFRLYLTETLLDYTVLKVLKTWTALLEAANLARIANLASSYILIESETNQFLLSKQARERNCASWAVSLSTARKRHCQQQRWCGQWSEEQTWSVWRCASTSHTSLFGPHCFGRFQPHAFHTLAKLERVFTVRSTNKQTTSRVAIPFVSSEKCARHDKLFASWNSCHWCREGGSGDVLHRLHGCQRISRIQSCVVYDYCGVCAHA